LIVLGKGVFIHIGWWGGVCPECIATSWNSKYDICNHANCN